MTENFDTFKACRTCATFYLSTSEYLRPIYNADFQTAEILEIRNEIKRWNIGISENDGYPQDICTICIGEFIKLLTFRTDCYNAQIQLQRIYRRDIRPLNAPENAELKLKAEIKTESDGDNDDNEDLVFLDEFSDENDEEKPIKNKSFLYIPIKKEEIGENETSENIGYNTSMNEISSEQNQTNDEIMEGHLGVMSTTIHTTIQSQSDFDGVANETATKAEIKTELEGQLNSNLESSLTYDGLSMNCTFCIYHENDTSEKNNFLSSAILQEHINTIHPAGKPYTCAYCEKSFYSVNNCKVHIKYEHSEMFVKKENLMITRQNKRAKWKSQEIRKKSISTIINRRILRNNSNDCAKCTQCDFICRSRLKLKNHIEEVHDKQDSFNTCSVCGKKCVSKKALQLHLKQHLKCKICQYCCKDFETDKEREQHVWSEHTDIAKKIMKKPNQSEIDTNHSAMTLDETENLPSCSNISLSQNKVQDELEDESNNTNDANGTLYSCAKCPAVFANQNFLLLHYKTEHGSNLPEHNCDICGQSFELKFSLNQHKKRMHSNDKKEYNHNLMEAT